MPDLHQLGNNLANSFEKLAKKKIPASSYVAFQRDKYLRACATEDWVRLEDQADTETDRANKKIAALEKQQSELASLNQQVQGYVEAARQEWTTLQSRDEWNDIKQRIKSELPPGTSQQKANEFIKELGRLHKGNVLSAVEKPLISRAESLHMISASWLSSFMGADLARTVSRFNKLKNPALESPSALSNWLADTNSSLQQLSKALVKAFRQKDIAGARNAARDLQQFGTGQNLEKATRAAAALAIARQNAVNRWVLGPVAADVGDVMRDLLMAESIGLIAGSAAIQEFGLADEWCTAAASLDFPSAWKAPKATAIQKLWTDPNQFDNTTVTIEGIAGPVINEHKNNKVFSSLWVMDPQGNGIRVGVIHIKLDSGGLVEGSYVRVTGKFRASDPEFPTPTVRVGRRKFTEDARLSMQDWMASRTQEIFTPIPHAFTMAFSWERSAFGAANQLRFGSWLPFRTRI